MENRIYKNQPIVYNSIPHQFLTHANQLTFDSWNETINQLRVQTNIISEYVESLHKWFIGTGEGFVSISDDGVFSEYVIESLWDIKRSITALANGEVLENFDSFLTKEEAEYKYVKKGTIQYEDLNSIPTINYKPIKGNLKVTDLGITSLSEVDIMEVLQNEGGSF